MPGVVDYNRKPLEVQIGIFRTLPDWTDPAILCPGDDMLSAYRLSSHGQWHERQQQLRYEPGFGSYGRAAMAADFGSSVEPLEHMRATGVSFLRVIEGSALQHELDPGDLTIGYACGCMHDSGECTHPDIATQCGAVLGDIPFGRKTLEHREIETKVLRFLLQEYGRGVSVDTLSRMVNIITHDEQSHTHQGLEAAHDTNGYLDGLWAGRLALEGYRNSDKNPRRLRQLRVMATTIMGNMPDLIAVHAKSFPAVDRILTSSEYLRDQIMLELGEAA